MYCILEQERKQQMSNKQTNLQNCKYKKLWIVKKESTKWKNAVVHPLPPTSVVLKKVIKTTGSREYYYYYERYHSSNKDIY